MSEMKHVLFVCTGNTCRSPMMEGLFRRAVADRNDYQVSSAGVAASKGAPSNPETVALLKRRNASLEDFSSKQITDAVLNDATHVFAMTHSHLQTLEAQFPDHADKFYLVCEFVDIPDQGIGTDVLDPIGLGRRAYEEVAGMFDAAIPTIIAYIDQTAKQPT